MKIILRINIPIIFNFSKTFKCTFFRMSNFKIKIFNKTNTKFLLVDFSANYEKIIELGKTF
jgi:hypothetical protein